MMKNGGHEGGHPTGRAFIELPVPRVIEVVEIRWTKLATFSLERAALSSGPLPPSLGHNIETVNQLEAISRLRCEYILAVLKA
eukprot:900532-Prorocentrum_lima.AAC.1